jgi:uncharacterized protein (TIGR02145 family)
MINKIAATLIITCLVSIAEAQTITNVNARQSGNSIVVSYDLNSNDYSTIRLFISEDGGETFQGPLSSVSGDVGGKIEGGSKEIIWDVLSDRKLLMGSNLVFRIQNEPRFSSFTDSRDGNSYKTLKIGNQIWMANDLRYKTGSYTWETAKNVCPDGWKLPSEDDFNTLIKYLESTVGKHSQIVSALLYGGALGFNAKLVEYNNYWDFDYIHYWSSTQNFHMDKPAANGMRIKKERKTSDTEVNVWWSYASDLEYVRCLKNTSKQDYFNCDSKISNFVIADENLPVNAIPVEIYIKKYVTQKIGDWQLKGEYEKTIDYQKRVNETTRNQKIQQFTNEAIKSMKKEYCNSVKWNNLTLSKYDADNETYLIQSDDLGQLAVPVPVADAQLFKNNWSNLKFSGQDFFVNNNKLVLAKLTITNPTNGKKYMYDSKQPTTYAASNITYNFKPIDVSVQQDNVVNNNILTENKTVIGSAEVDINIPTNPQTNDKTFAVIIANENYQKEVKVQFAANDGKVFKEYCEKTLGIPTKNIHFVQDASFGNMKSELRWISEVAQAYNGQAKILFYYAGHGMPNEQDKSAYLLPVDGFSTDYGTAIRMDELYNSLSQYPTQNVTVFLDACFSGSIRDNGMLASARGIKIKPKADMLKGKMVVFSAATGEETAYPYKEKQHGLFTYFLLKKLQETKGNVDYLTLSNYIIENVKQQSVVVNQKSQTPQVNASPEILSSWQMMKIK